VADLRQREASMIERTAADILRAAGLPSPPSLQYGCGRYYECCPRCSAQRSTATNRSAKVLGITIDDLGVKWGCNHCGWTGGGYFKGGKSRGDDGFGGTYDYDDAPGRQPFTKSRQREMLRAGFCVA